MFGKRSEPSQCKIGRPCGLGCVPKDHKAVKEGQVLRLTRPTKIEGLISSPQGTLYKVAEIVSKNPLNRESRAIVVQAKSPQDLNGEVTAYWLGRFLKFNPYLLA